MPGFPGKAAPGPGLEKTIILREKRKLRLNR
jgi:hypothetical protein